MTNELEKEKINWMEVNNQVHTDGGKQNQNPKISRKMFCFSPNYVRVSKLSYESNSYICVEQKRGLVTIGMVPLSHSLLVIVNSFFWQDWSIKMSLNYLTTCSAHYFWQQWMSRYRLMRKYDGISSFFITSFTMYQFNLGTCASVTRPIF